MLVVVCLRNLFKRHLGTCHCLFIQQEQREQENNSSELLDYCTQRTKLRSADQSASCQNDFGNHFSTRQ